LNSKALLILGSHRSGTSALAGALVKLGVYFGNDLLPPQPDNQKGFFESRRIVELHDQILESLNSRWDDPRPLPESWLRLPITKNYQDSLVKILQDEFLTQSLWAVKDPRLCRLLPLWQVALDELGIQGYSIITLRHPDEVIQSLQKRDNFSGDHCRLLWFRYFSEALEHSSSMQRAFVEYNQLLLDPHSTLQLLAEQLSIQWPIAVTTADTALQTLLDKNLKHQSYGNSFCESNADTIFTQALYSQVLTGTQSGRVYTPKPHTSERVQSQNVISSSYASVIGRLYEEQRVYRGEIYILQGKNITLETQHLQTLKDTQLILAEKDKIKAEKDNAEEKNAQLYALISSIQSSRSWRVTRPLREAGNWYRKHIKPRLKRDIAITEREQVAASRYRLARTLWRTVPLTQGQRQNLKTYLHRHLPGLLTWIVADKGMAFGLVRDSTVTDSAAVPPLPHKDLVSIIVCVHNALEVTQSCLYSVVRHTQTPYELIIVDDGSSEETKSFLKDFTHIWQATLIRHDNAHGYTKAANAGLSAAHGTWMVLLNSDTQVGPEWLDRMVACGTHDARIGVIGPLSNTASWQSVPEVFSGDGDWADNPLPEHIDIPSYSRILQRYSGLVYPRLAFLNGFCFMIRKTCLDEVGNFDENLFPQGYGEENDFCIRARRHGWSLAVADDVFVYHAQSKSYSHNRRYQLANRADQVLRQQYGDLELFSGAAQCRDNLSLAGARWRVQKALVREDYINTARLRYEGLRLAIILPVADEGGGAHVVLQEVAALLRMGVAVTIFNLAANAKQFQQSYPDCNATVSFCANISDLQQKIYHHSLAFDAIITTAFYSVPWLLPVPSGAPPLFYYVQDYEPFFFPADSQDREAAFLTYQTIPEMMLLTKTRWNARLLRQHAQKDAFILGPSVDVDTFRPRESRSSQDGRVRVCAMIRPATPRRAPLRTIETLRALVQNNPQVELHTFGCYKEELNPLLRGNSWFPDRHKHHGRLTHHEVAALLPQMDIFLDYSDFQAMGLTAMEAMSCGCAVVVPKEGGAEDFAENGVNALIVDTSNATECIKVAQRLAADRSLRERLSRAAAESILQWAPETAALRILEAIAASSQEGRPQREKS